MMKTLSELAEQVKAEWSDKYGVDFPQSIREWEELAVRAGANLDDLKKSDLDDLTPLIQGYLLRLRDGRSDTNSATPRQNTVDAADATPAGGKTNAHPKPVNPRYKPPKCPNCKKNSVDVTGVKKEYRNLKCRDCGLSFTLDK